jgi:hypothetical protein
MNIKRFNKPSVHLFLLVLVSFGFYAHTFDAGFVYDDYVHNGMIKAIKSNNFEMNIFRFATTPQEVDLYTQMTALPWWTNPLFRINYFRPLPTLIQYLEFTIWQDNAVFYHVTSVMWYVLLVVLIYFLYNAFCNNNAMAFLGALIFTLKPSNYMAVRWVASRNEIICATFLAISFICYLLASKNKRPLHYILFFTCYFLALLSKEGAFLLPIFIFAYDWSRYNGLKDVITYRWKIYLSLLLINAVYFIFYTASGYGSYWYAGRFFIDHPRDFLQSIGFFLTSLFYGGTILGPDLLSRFWFLFITMIILLFYILFRIWEQRRKYPEITLFLVWTLSLLPFIVVPPIHDRVLLIPSIGYAYLAALVISRKFKRWLVVFFIITGLLLPSTVNVIQVGVYDEVLQKNYERLFSALDRMVTSKTPRDKLFFINFPGNEFVEASFMYMALYHTLEFHYPSWKVPVYPLSPFDDEVTVKVIDDYHIEIFHPTRFYFETDLEKLFSLDRTFKQGETFTLPGVKLAIRKVEGKRVKAVAVEFSQPIDSPNYYFLYYDGGEWQRWFPDEAKNPFK